MRDEDRAGATAACTLDRGSRIGRYLVLSLVGRGGMGEVYAAYDPELDRRVAIKLMRTVRAIDRRRLAREARALGKLSHPNVVQVYDVGDHAGNVFVAMEFVEGQSLEAWCRSDPRPAWQVVLAAYLDAARGLSAAHEKGLVHRDVKPSNILRGDDGRVRVVDFGLAAGRDATSDEGAPAPPREAAQALIAAPLDETLPTIANERERCPSAAVLDWRVTVTDALMGTPIYMAPEQHDVPKVGPASDQYSLCVALYQGLYGALPFAITAGAELRSAMDQLRDQKRRGVLQPPVGAPVPSWVSAALARGLAPRPEDRYPSLDALIAALSHDPFARSRARLRHAGTGVAVAAVLALSAVRWAKDSAFHEHPEPPLSGDEPAKARPRSAFVSTAALPPIADCADVEALTARVPLPEDPAVRVRTAKLEMEVHELEALFGAGKFRDGLSRGRPLLAEATSLGYAPLRAQVEFWMGRLRDGTGDYEEARALLHAAAVSAAEGKDDVLAANAWARLLIVVGYVQQRFEEAAAIRELGPTAVVRVHDARTRANWLNAEGLFLYRTGKHAEAKAMHERALRLREEALGPDDPEVARSLNNLGLALAGMGDYAAARAAHERALSLRERVLGPSHPEVALSLNNLGVVLQAMGEYARALPIHERSLALWEQVLGPDHPDVARALDNLGALLTQLGDSARAVSVHERAVAIRERALGPDHADVARSLYHLGSALASAGDAARARASFERALLVGERAIGRDHADVARMLPGIGNANLDTELRLALAEALWQEGSDRPRARALAEQARAFCERIDHRPGLARATRWLLEHRTGSPRGQLTMAPP